MAIGQRLRQMLGAIATWLGSLPGTTGFARLGIRQKLATLFYLVTLTALAVVGGYGYWHASEAYRSKAVALASSSTQETAGKIRDMIALARNDIGFISQFYAMRRYLYWNDIGDADKMTYWRDIASDTLRNFMEAYNYHYKIRLFTEAGDEALVVRRDLATGKVWMVDDKDLQNKAGRDYIQASQGLKDGEIYFVPISFNTEHGQVEKPLVPVLRLVTPLLSADGTRYGYASASLLANSLFEPLRSANKNAFGLRYYLVDGQGQFLFHPDAERAYGRLLGHGASFSQEHHSLMDDIKGRQEGMVIRGGHIHAWQRLQFDSRHPETDLYLVSVIDESAALAELNSFVLFFLLLLAAVAAGVLLATRYMVGVLMSPLQFVTRQLKRLGRGEAEPEDLDYPARDEIREMLDSSDKVVANMQTLARQADTIAAGDLSGRVEPLSENDRLGNALNNMTRQLAANRRSDEQRNWLKDGLSRLNHALTGDLTPQQLADQAISQVGRYLEAGRGVLYVWRDDDLALDLLGSYMYTERRNLGATVHLGEGAIGQVARERKPIILDLGGAGDDAAPIATGTVTTPPRHTHTWPLLRENVLYGVMEVAGSRRLDELEIDYLGQAADIVASFLHAVLQRERIKELLVTAEESARQANEQSRRLQEANSMMEEQQQQLQQQTEELQQANAQMEEQQQQLQQQTEELQQTNAQMEEQQQQLQQQTEELRQANAQMEGQQRQLEQQAGELERRNQELEQASRYKSDFLANMSHELRTPLNSIILLSKMLAVNDRAHLDEEEIKRAGVIHAAGSDLLTLINDILDLSKIEAGKMEVHPVAIDSQAMLADFERQFEDTAHVKGLEFRLEDGWQGEFTSDRDKLNQIIRNLLSNAFKFTRSGRVTLALRRREEAGQPLCVAVTDTGIGIPDDKRQLIFEAFQQVDGSISRQFGGTGLGLSISLRLAQLLGGTIEVSSTLGEGSEFRLLLPAALTKGHEVPAMTGTPAPALPARLPEAKPARPTPSRAADVPADDRGTLAPGNAVILVIDDDTVFGEAITYINRQHGYKTLLAGSGEEGLRLAEAYRPNGILLDLSLPDMDGLDVLKSLKTSRTLRNTPVYIVSGRERDAGIPAQDIVGYLQKPVDDRQLLAVEQEVLQHARSARLVMVLEGGGLSAGRMREVLAADGVAIEASADVEAAVEACAGVPCGLVLVGLDAGADFQPGLERCRILRERLPDLPILVYSLQPISSEQEAALRRYTDSIVIQASQAERRILENVERFLRDVRSGGGQAQAAQISGAKDRLRNRRILVVDDDARNLFVVTSALEQQGAKVSNALNGRKALDLLRNQPVDLVFMDIMMPEMDGYEAITAIKTDPVLKAIPVIALTAKALKSDRQDALDAGADDYLAKPVDYDVLVNMAAVWCGRKA